tara:strand:+ start:109466 stop:110719 length:1254 start_codon:yes stop_codon:yes gene_type:complete
MWLYPIMCSVASAILAYYIIYLDKNHNHYNTVPWLSDLNIGIQATRQVFIVTTSGVLTLTGVVFSISMVALTMASSQFGPKVLRNFISDSTNKLILGILISTFMYGLITLSLIDGKENGYTPLYAMFVNLLLTSASIAGIIYFIHRISTSIQADQIISEIARDISNNTHTLCNNELADINDSELQWENITHENAYTVSTCHSGYVQSINYEGLTKLIADNQCTLFISTRAGKFILPNASIGTLYKNEFDKSLINQILDCISIDRKRTPIQDLEYSIEQLVQVTLRALSPGINDSITAITCVDWLSSSILELAECNFSSTVLTDSDGIVRLKYNNFSFEGAVNTAISPIRQNCCNNVMVSVHLLENLVTMHKTVSNADYRNIILKQINALVSKIHLNNLSAIDQKKIDSIIENLDESL